MKCYGCAQPLCGVCKTCHTVSCGFFDLQVLDAASAVKFKHLSAKTQKIRGFVALDKINLSVPKPFFVVSSEGDCSAVVEACRMGSKTAGEMFVRPCPTRPRHGFEESRKVAFGDDNAVSSGELVSMFNRAVAADEQGTAELLLLPYINAEYNLIVTPSMMAVGPGHDGATAGKSSIAIPLMGTPFFEVADNPQLLAQANIADTEDPYVEAVVERSGKVYFTQLRAGAKTAGIKDYIPERMVVTHVVTPSDDLLEWEQQVKRLQPGAVVCKVGGTLIAHYGVHCLYNKVPCMTTRVPAVGETLNPVGKAPSPNAPDMIRGLGEGALIPLNTQTEGYFYVSTAAGELSVSECLVAMMVALHNSGAMSGEDAYWLGFGTSIMMRAGMAASHGEARHKLEGYSGQSMRRMIYTTALKDFLAARKTLGVAQWMFRDLRWTSSYGGPKWAQCTESLLSMDVAIRSLLNDPSSESVTAVVSALNIAVNQAHNGGWWLNKFIEQNYFDKTSKQSLTTLVLAGATMYKAQAIGDSIDRREIEKLLLDWQTAPTIEVGEGNLQIQEKVTAKFNAKLHAAPGDGSNEAPPDDSDDEEASTEDYDGDGTDDSDDSDGISYQHDHFTAFAEDHNLSIPDGYEQYCKCSMCSIFRENTKQWAEKWGYTIDGGSTDEPEVIKNTSTVTPRSLPTPSTKT